MNANENTTITCAECGCIEETLVEIDGKYYCVDCLERLGYVKCYECGDWIPGDEACPTSDGYVCETCAGDLGLEECEECGLYSNDTALVLGRYRAPHMYCRSCLDRAVDDGRVYWCEDCDQYYEERYYQSFTTAGSRTICENCFYDNYTACPDCGEVFHNEDMYWCEADDTYYCINCIDDHQPSDHEDCIKSYSCKPSPIFHGTANTYSVDYSDPITMGFELEVDKGNNRGDCAYDLDQEFGYDTLYMKNDSSVDFEIVTHPHTLAAYLNNFDFDRLCEIPLNYGYKSHDAKTCGFHIHVGRTQLARAGREQMRVIGRIAVLMYRHWASLVKFSRRTESQLNSWACSPSFNFRYCRNEEDIYDEIENYYAGASRYQALNLQPRDTIEFRLWRGSLKPQTLKATLQLTSNIVLFAREHTMYDVINSSWEDITNFETTPDLESYLHDLNLDTEQEPRPIALIAKTEEPTPDNDPFIIPDGRRVIIINDRGSLVCREMVGATGTVLRHSNTGWGETEYLLRIDPEFCRLGMTHDGFNHECPDNNGYFAYLGNLGILPEQDNDNAVSF